MDLQLARQLHAVADKLVAVRAALARNRLSATEARTRVASIRAEALEGTPEPQWAVAEYLRELTRRSTGAFNIGHMDRWLEFESAKLAVELRAAADPCEFGPAQFKGWADTGIAHLHAAIGRLTAQPAA